MAVRFVCDCCSCAGGDGEKFEERGIVKKKHYCDECVKAVDEFIAARDKLRTEAAEKLKADVDLLLSGFKEKHPTMSLPDA